MRRIRILDDFRRFLLRGNVVDLAVAVVVGAAFGALVTALVKDLLTPIVAAIFGQHDFSTLSFTINGSRFAYGAFVNELVAFLSAAAAVFFFVVRPITTLIDRFKTEPPLDQRTRNCPECLSEIPQLARRCAHCTTALAPAA